MLLATQHLSSDSIVRSSGTFDFGPDPYVLTQILTLNLQPSQGVPDYTRLLGEANGFYYGTFTVQDAPEPTTFVLLSTGLLGCWIIASRRKRR